MNVETVDVVEALTAALHYGKGLSAYLYDVGYVYAAVDSEDESTVVLETGRGDFLLTVTALEDA